MASSSCSATASPCADGISDDFAAWIVENGGDDDLVGRLKSNGFNSKLSLSNLDLSSTDAAPFVRQLNYGQRCLLKGLTKLCGGKDSENNSISYESVATKSVGLANKSVSIKEKIGKLFHFDSAATAKTRDFKPSSAYKKSGAIKRKGSLTSLRGKGPLKKKVKEINVKVKRCLFPST